MTAIDHRQPAKGENAAVFSMLSDRTPGTECESYAALMHMAVQHWHCPVCGWRWTITTTPDNRIEALGTHSNRNRIAVVDITRLATPAPSAGHTALHSHSPADTAP